MAVLSAPGPLVDPLESTQLAMPGPTVGSVQLNAGRLDRADAVGAAEVGAMLVDAWAPPPRCSVMVAVPVWPSLLVAVTV